MASLSNPLPTAFAEGTPEAGCDEAGRGCLAGPVCAAAVILPPDFTHPWLNDSKQLTERRREMLRPIIEKEALAWAVAMVDNEEIDRINILNASILAMHRALDGLAVRPTSVIVDGNRFKPYGGIPWANAPRKAPRIWLERKQRLSHGRPPRRHSLLRSHPLPPHVVQTARPPADPVLGIMRNSIIR